MSFNFRNLLRDMLGSVINNTDVRAAAADAVRGVTKKASDLLGAGEVEKAKRLLDGCHDHADEIAHAVVENTQAQAGPAPGSAPPRPPQ